MKIDKVILGLPDFHGEAPFVPLLCRFAKILKPTHIVWMGDLGAWDAVSPFDYTRTSALNRGQTVEREWKEIRSKIWLPFQRANPRAKNIILTGNHDFWLTEESNRDSRYGEMNAWPAIMDRIAGSGLPYELIDINRPWKASRHLHYIHGTYTNIHHAKKHVDAFHRTLLYGHTHDIQEHTAVSPIDVTEIYYGKSCGCLCNRNPVYSRNRPFRFAHGFSIAYILNDETFSETTIRIINSSHFCYAGKIFQ